MRNPETAIQTSIRKYLNSRRIWNIRVNADGNIAGEPDIIACYRGYLIGLEVKRPKEGKPTDLQRDSINEIIRNGGFGGFPTSVKDVEDILWEVDETIRLGSRYDRTSDKY